MTTRMQQRRDTAAAWTSANPVLAAGELGAETDTGKLKVGDGSTAWSSLPYAGAGLDLEAVQDAVAAMLVAGSNVTLAYDDALGKLTVSAAGGTGGGGGSSPDPRYTPQTGTTTVDEFDDASLAAGWVRVDSAAGGGVEASRVTWTETGSVLVADNAGGDGSGKIHALMWDTGAPMAVGDCFETCMSLDVKALNYAMAGLVLSDSNTYGSGNQLTPMLFETNGGPLFELYRFTGFQSGASVTALGESGVPDLGQLFNRIVYLGSNQYRVDTSRDGFGWRKGTVVTVSGVGPFRYVGFISSTYGGAAQYAATYEYLRKRTGVS